MALHGRHPHPPARPQPAGAPPPSPRPCWSPFPPAAAPRAPAHQQRPGRARRPLQRPHPRRPQLQAPRPPRHLRPGGPRLRPRPQIERRRVKRCAPKAASSAATGPLYWGAWIGNQLTGDEAPWDMSAVAKFEGMAGKAASLVNFSSPFADCSKAPCSFYEFPDGGDGNDPRPRLDARSSAGPRSRPRPASNQPDFQLADVIAGHHDAYIREFAEGARDWGHPFFLRFNWEMNGNWFAWSEGVNGNQPGEYVAAWRHVHDIFTQVGATNATWVWCPNVDPGKQAAGPGLALPRRRLRRLDRPRRLQLGHQPGLAATAGRASTSSSNRPTTASSRRSRRASR